MVKDWICVLLDSCSEDDELVKLAQFLKRVLKVWPSSDVNSLARKIKLEVVLEILRHGTSVEFGSDHGLVHVKNQCLFSSFLTELY